MKYLLLFCVEEKTWDTMSAEELEAIRSSSDRYDEELKRDGHLLYVQRLQSTREATTVRVRQGKTSYTDGPFAETKESIAGLIVLEAQNLDEALSIVSRSPLARIGSVEVRPGFYRARAALDLRQGGLLPCDLGSHPQFQPLSPPL